MKQEIQLVVAVALIGCGGTEQPNTEIATSALEASSLKVGFANPPGGCDNRQYSGDGDWYSGACKTECASAATGIASTHPKYESCSAAVVCPHAAPQYDTDCSDNWTDMLACDDRTASVNLGSAYTLKFARSNDQRFPTVGYDWAPNLIKGECDNSHAITAIATDQNGHDSDSLACQLNPFGTWASARGVLGARCSALTSPPGFVTVAQLCTALDFGQGDARESTASGDWDKGFLKGECGPGRFIKGIAHGGVGDGSGQAVRILCCTPAVPQKVP